MADVYNETLKIQDQGINVYPIQCGEQLSDTADLNEYFNEGHRYYLSNTTNVQNLPSDWSGTNSAILEIARSNPSILLQKLTKVGAGDHTIYYRSYDSSVPTINDWVQINNSFIDCVRIIGDDTKTGSFAVRPPDGTTQNYTLSIYPATTISTTTRASFGMIGNDPQLYLTVYDTSDNEHIVFTVPNDTGVLTINSGLSIPGQNLTISGSGSQTIDSTASRWLSLFNGLTGTQQRGIIFQKSGSSGSENVQIQRSINGALSGGILQFNIDNGQTEFFTQCNFTSLIRGTAGNWSINTDGAANFLSTVTASAFYQSSDRNSKDNITAITDEDIEKVKNVELVSYNFENDTTKRYGVVAQEVEEAGLTNLVHTDTKDKKTVDYISLLILKIEQLQKEVNELKSKVYGG